MQRRFINNVNDFVDQIPKFTQNQLKLSESTKNILKMVYSKSSFIEEPNINDQLKPPLIISFHPKTSLLNNNVHETFFAEKIATKLGMIPIWIPYVYDTGYKTASNKIRLQ